MDNKKYKEEIQLEERFGRDRHRQVPEGYFARMADEVISKLPDQAPVERHVNMTRWERMKPYVYLAAMFCGIWLMMNVFQHVTGMGDYNLDNPPEQIAQIMSSPEATEIFSTMPTMLSDMELEDAVAAEYDNISQLEADFNKIDDMADSMEDALDADMADMAGDDSAE